MLICSIFPLLVISNHKLPLLLDIIVVHFEQLLLSVIEKFEELESRISGETSAADLLNVQKLRKELSDAHVISCKLLTCFPHAYHAFHCLIIPHQHMQSLDESQIPDSLLERLLEGRTEFPPVCAIIGGILGQVIYAATVCLLKILVLTAY